LRDHIIEVTGGAGEGNRTLVFSLEVSGFSQCFQEPFRHFAAFWAIEITTEFLFVGMAIVSFDRECIVIGQTLQLHAIRLRTDANPGDASAFGLLTSPTCDGIIFHATVT
jgi:hypothetical protein